MEIKRRVTVQSIFWRFLFWFCAMGVGLAIICLVIFAVATNSGLFYPANYGESTLEANRTKIESAKKVTKDMIPSVSHFGVYAKDGTFLYGNLKEGNRKSVWQEYIQGGSGDGQMGYLKYFQREDDICIAVYHLKAEFVNPKLRQYLPGLPESLLILFALVFVIQSVLLIRRFGHNMSGEIRAVKQVTEKVKRKDLDFEKPKSHIYEIDEVMDSLMNMKEALEDSLKQQWSMEEMKRRQVRALAHDIKTPLTVIRGNTQLLGESKSEEESRELEGCILKETERIERYLQILQEILVSEGEVVFQREKIPLRAFVENFLESARALTAAKEQKLEVVNSYQLDYINSDRQLLRRAWENILHNAVEYTPKGGRILVRIEETGAFVYFQVEDDGPGFTKEDIRYGAEQFYQGDKSRGVKNHYGMGLFIVKSFIDRQGGRLALEHSKTLYGACVRLEIDICRME